MKNGMDKHREDTKNADSSQYLGLDPIFRTYLHFYVSEILVSETYMSCNDCFIHNSRVFTKVDIMGILIKVYKSERFIVYTLDDGTGVINCINWSSSKKSGDVANDLRGHLPNVLQEFVLEIVEDQEVVDNGYNLGDYIHVRGRVKIYGDKKEILINFHKKIKDPLEELVRMVELPEIHRKYYDQPFKLPKQAEIDIAANLEEIDTGDTLKAEFKDAIINFVEVNSIKMFTLKDLEKEQHLCKIADQPCKAQGTIAKENILQLALDKLEDQGLILTVGKQEDDINYMVLENDRCLEKDVMDCLKRESTIKTGDNVGVHYMHILEDLRKCAIYSNLKKTALTRTLTELEAQSVIIRITNFHYMPL